MLRRATRHLGPTLYAFMFSLCSLALPNGEVVIPLLLESMRRAGCRWGLLRGAR